MKKQILVIFGGVSTEHEISRLSASFVIESLNREKYDVYQMGITKKGAWFLYTGETEQIKNGLWENDAPNLLPAVLSPCAVHHGVMALDKARKEYKIIHIDCAFPALHGKNGEDGTVQGLLTLSGIPFVGCGVFASALCMDKVAAKMLCEKAGIATTPFVAAKNDAIFDKMAFALKAEESFGYPMFVKPSGAGSSVGVTKAKNHAELLAGFDTAFQNDTKILVEKAMPGKEIEVALLGDAFHEAFATVCAEIEPNAEFYDYDTKYLNDTAAFFIPAKISESAARKVRETAKKAFAELSCFGLARADFFVDGEDVVFNEINTIPGLTAISMYPRLMKEAGFPPETLMEKLIDIALEARP